MRYAIARRKKEQRDEAYRIYITDALYSLTNNHKMLKRYKDVLDALESNKAIEARSGDEIAIDIIKRAGLQNGAKVGG